jgi:hypothetical protein
MRGWGNWRVEDGRLKLVVRVKVMQGSRDGHRAEEQGSIGVAAG